jgi:hypothetical protein
MPDNLRTGSISESLLYLQFLELGFNLLSGRGLDVFQL